MWTELSLSIHIERTESLNILLSDIYIYKLQ